MAKAQGRRRRGDRTCNVRDIMVKEVVTIEPSASLTDAARAMEDANIGMLPVVQDGKVLGVITDRDIVVRAVAREADPASTAVGGLSVDSTPSWRIPTGRPSARCRRWPRRRSVGCRSWTTRIDWWAW